MAIIESFELTDKRDFWERCYITILQQSLTRLSLDEIADLADGSVKHWESRFEDPSTG
jgi:hypothetical protein